MSERPVVFVSVFSRTYKTFPKKLISSIEFCKTFPKKDNNSEFGKNSVAIMLITNQAGSA